LIETEFGPGLAMTDRFNLVERQLRVLGLEAKNLTHVVGQLDSVLSPREFSDMAYSLPKTCTCGDCSAEYPEDDNTVFCPECRKKEKWNGQSK
jgi:hypothetical protein